MDETRKLFFNQLSNAVPDSELSLRKTEGLNLNSVDTKLDYGNVLLVPGTQTAVSSRKDVNLQCRIHFAKHPSIVYEGVPIMAANMDGVGTLKMADSLLKHQIFTCLTKSYPAQSLIEFFQGNPVRKNYCAMTVGLREADRNTFAAVNKSVGPLPYVCLDVANGHTERFVRFLERFRNDFNDVVIIAGNVVTPEQTYALADAGADLVKVGIGPGSVCETRIKTGVGYPQFSAVIECGQAAREAGVAIVADGGCTCPGDVAKAIAAGAGFTMLGGMLAGHDEGGGNVVTRTFQSTELEDGKPLIKHSKFVQFYGMSSHVANEKHFDGMQPWKASEGREVLLPYKASLMDTIQDILGGLRSTCTYLGAKNLSDLPSKARFVRCHDTHNRVFEDFPIS
ncbi:MAG: IMP dehydrogenase [Rhodobacteraceae bacterium]|nr:IMP dehydrogenase [Paracoccaceae bacterium]